MTLAKFKPEYSTGGEMFQSHQTAKSPLEVYLKHEMPNSQNGTTGESLWDKGV